MAKKKEKVETETTASPPTPTQSSDLVKKYGEQAFVSAVDFLKEKRDIIPVSPKLDMILGGGIPEGSFVILAGKPKCGKTSTSLHFAANAQKFGRKVYFFNIEGRLKPRDLLGIPHLDHTQVEVIRSYKDDAGQTRILLAHEYLEIAERKIKEDPGCIIIIDSASMLLTEPEQLCELGKQQRAPGAVLLSQFCKKISNILPVSGCVVIMMVHIVANTGGFGKATSRTGGNKIQYAVDVDLECLYTKKWSGGDDSGKEEEDKKSDEGGPPPVGQKIIWKTGSTGIAPPGMQTVSYLRYGKGIDEVYEVVDLARTIGIIRKSGAWNYFDFLADRLEEFELDKIPNIQGVENVLKTLGENPKWVEILKQKVKEILG